MAHISITDGWHSLQLWRATVNVLIMLLLTEGRADPLSPRLWYYGMWQSIMECDKVLWNVTKYYGMWQSIMECDKALWNVTKCYGMWQSIMECDKVLWNVTKYYGMWQSILDMDVFCTITKFAPSLPSAEVKKEWSHTFTPAIHLYVVGRQNFTLTKWNKMCTASNNLKMPVHVIIVCTSIF